MKKVLILCVVLICFKNLKAQDYRVGKISKEELLEKVYSADSTANAVKLYVNRRVYFDYSQNEGFKLVTEVQERIKIYNKEGYDWATKEIKYYTPSGSEIEKINIQEAKTYVLENGKVESYKLKNNEIFTEKQNKYWSVDKFTMPNIVDGCIIEWKYSIISPYKSIDKIVLQSSIPIKKFEASIEIPEYYSFNLKETGYYKINSMSSTKYDNILISSSSRPQGSGFSSTHTNFSTQKIEFKTNVTKIDNENIPAIIEEPFVNNIKNYATTLHFELAFVNWPQTPIEYFSQSWEDVTRTIYKNSDFGLELEKSGYFKDDLNAIIAKSAGNKQQLVSNILAFVKQKVKWNKVEGIFTYNGVREAYKNGIGNVADINFILIAMLREAGLYANPVILSTRDNGVPIFPTIDGFNYVIAGLEVENDVVLLDATELYSTPNILPLRVLNWQGRIVRESGSSTWVNLIPKTLSETNNTLDISIKTNGEIDGLKRTMYINNSGFNYRNKFANSSDDKIIEKNEEAEKIEILDFKVVNIQDIDKSIVELYKFNKKNAVDIIGGKIYFKPLFFTATTKNPFKLENREYPIDFGAPFSNKDIISINIPDGYEIESIPESIAIGLPNNMGVYQFKILVTGAKINVFSLLKIEAAAYPAENYKELKEFFKLLVNKNVEQIILKEVGS